MEISILPFVHKFDLKPHLRFLAFLGENSFNYEKDIEVEKPWVCQYKESENQSNPCSCITINLPTQQQLRVKFGRQAR